MKYLIILIVIVALQVDSCSKKQDSPQNVVATPTETQMLLQKDLVERADEMCKELGDCQQALILYSQALERDNDKAVEIYGHRAMAYYAVKDFDKAISDFTTAIERKSNESARWFFMRGLSKSMLSIEDRMGACKDFKSAKKRGFVSTNIPGAVKSFNEWVVEYCATKNLSF
jgi:tetratricopeptide (TPR) repeat protein